MERVLTPQPPRSKREILNRITLVKGDITRQTGVDAIVSTIPSDLSTGRSLNTLIIAAAGEALDDFILENIYRPRPGDAFAVPGFDLPVEHVIFVVTPVWHSDFDIEDKHLLQAYRHAMQEAYRMGLKRIAFPALGTGKGHYPVKRAVRLALQAMAQRFYDELEEVRFVCNRDETYNEFAARLKAVGWKERKTV